MTWSIWRVYKSVLCSTGLPRLTNWPNPWFLLTFSKNRFCSCAYSRTHWYYELFWMTIITSHAKCLLDHIMNRLGETDNVRYRKCYNTCLCIKYFHVILSIQEALFTVSKFIYVCHYFSVPIRQNSLNNERRNVWVYVWFFLNYQRTMLATFVNIFQNSMLIFSVEQQHTFNKGNIMKQDIDILYQSAHII